MSPSCSSGVPVTRSERNRPSLSPAVSRTVWIAGPPTLSRAMMRRTLIVSAAGPAAASGSNGAIAAQPFDGPLHALLHADGRLVAQQRLGLADVGLRMEDVPGPGLVVDRGQVLAEVGADQLHQPVERDPLAAGDVDGLAGDPWGGAGEQAGLDRVLHVGEVARVLAVAEDARPLVGEQRLDEARDDRRVLGRGVLARPEHVEVAERHRLETVDPREHAAVELAGQLVDGVGR